MGDGETSSSGVLRAGILYCPLITICVHLAGSAVFCGVLSGPLGILFTPVLCLFGFPYLLPELFGVGLQWIVYHPQKGRRHFWTVMLVSVILAGTLVGLLGPKEQGSEWEWALAYAAAAATSAASSLVAIRLLKLLLLQ